MFLLEFVSFPQWESGIISHIHSCRETMLDPTAVFALLFGSELFEDYIGHLAVASMASSELAGESDNPEKVHDKLKVVLILVTQILPFLAGYVNGIVIYMEFWFIDYDSNKAIQREREEKLAMKLRDFLQQYVGGDRDGFMRKAESEAERLSLAC